MVDGRGSPIKVFWANNQYRSQGLWSGFCVVLHIDVNILKNINYHNWEISISIHLFQRDNVQHLTHKTKNIIAPNWSQRLVYIGWPPARSSHCLQTSHSFFDAKWPLIMCNLKCLSTAFSSALVHGLRVLPLRSENKQDDNCLLVWLTTFFIRI